MPESEGYVGPKTVEPHHLQDVVALSESVFRGVRNMREKYPLVYHAGRLEQLRIFECGGRPVSLVATVLNEAVLLGCSVRVAAVGSVCTDQAHRGQGLAGRLVDDAVARAKAAGAAVMLISGGRTLYTRRGAARCGRFHRYDIPRDSLPQPDGSVSLDEITRQNAGTALRLYDAEPIRFRRSEEDYAEQIACGWTMNRPGFNYLLRRGKTPVAVICLNRSALSRQDPTEILGLWEMAGPRRAILGALREVLDRFGLQTVIVHAYESDRAMLDACAEIGIRPELEPCVGTVKLLDAARLWSDFAPLIGERIGPQTYARIRVCAEADELKIHTLVFERDRERLSFEGADEIAAALFGSRELQALATHAGPLAEILRRALPLPLPMYGLNYA